MVIIFWNMQTLLFLCKYLVVFLHLRNLALEFAHLFLLEYFLVFDRDDLDELIQVLFPVIENQSGQMADGMMIMLADQFMKFLS